MLMGRDIYCGNTFCHLRFDGSTSQRMYFMDANKSATQVLCTVNFVKEIQDFCKFGIKI